MKVRFESNGSLVVSPRHFRWGSKKFADVTNKISDRIEHTFTSCSSFTTDGDTEHTLPKLK